MIIGGLSVDYTEIATTVSTGDMAQYLREYELALFGTKFEELHLLSTSSLPSPSYSSLSSKTSEAAAAVVGREVLSEGHPSSSATIATHSAGPRKYSALENTLH